MYLSTDLYKLKPYEEYQLMRNYPDGATGFGKRLQVLEEVRAEQAFSSNTLRNNAQWELHGPHNIGGRINTIAVNPQNHNEVMIGNAAGGIFKTTDDGENWSPVFDGQSYLAIGKIAYDPNNTQIVYAGTGDPNIGGYVQIGDGVYKSTDGGNTWENMGLKNTGIISKIAINPNNSNEVYVATMGIPFVQDKNRGLYKSTNGGESWEQVLYLAPTAGIIDMVMLPENPDTIFVAGWNRSRTHFSSIGSGPNSKVYRTFNGGETWDTLTTDLPTGDQSRIGLSLSGEKTPSLWVQIVGTNYETEGIYKSTDFGDSFTKLPATGLENILGGFGWYFGKIRVNPWNADQVFVLGVDMFKSTDGGESFNMCTPPWYYYEVHADKHDLTFIDQNTMLLSTDGGMYKSTDGGYNWTDYDRMPNTQFYRIAIDPHNTGYYMGGAQDNGTSYGNKNVADWIKVLGGDGFQPVFDPEDENMIYAETQWGGIYAFELVDGISPEGFELTNYTKISDGLEDTDRKCWDLQYQLSPLNHTTLFAGTYQLYKLSNSPSGTWETLTDDLTDGTEDRYHVITALCASSHNEDEALVGTSDGKVHIYSDGEVENITEGLPERYVTSVQISPDNANHFFVSNTGYRLNEYVPHLHFSEDRGQTWIDITGDLPQLGINNIEVIKGYNSDVIFAATDGGVYHTLNRGGTWELSGTGMPVVTVYDIAYDSIQQEMAAGTFARSLMTLDIRAILDQYNTVEEKALATFEIYPNPASEWLNLKGDVKTNDKVYIYALDGKQMLCTSWANESISIKNITKGNYILTIERNGNKIGTKKLTIQ
jgi:photosystem II stability/assembly factor-like uncharacterized protein